MAKQLTDEVKALRKRVANYKASQAKALDRYAASQKDAAKAYEASLHR